jgi:hypothetical protein
MFRSRRIGSSTLYRLFQRLQDHGQRQHCRRDQAATQGMRNLAGTHVLWNSWIQLSLRNESVLNESLWMKVFWMRGIAFYTWQIGTRHRQRKWCQDLHRGALSRCNFKTGDILTLSTMLGNLITMLAYIYSIHARLSRFVHETCFTSLTNDLAYVGRAL